MSIEDLKTTIEDPKKNKKLSLSTEDIMNLLKKSGAKTVITGEPRPPAFFDVCENEKYGNMFALDNNIYFLSVWDTEFLIDFYVRFGNLLANELSKRGVEIKEG